MVMLSLNKYVWLKYIGFFSPWYLYLMLAQNTVRTYTLNQVFRVVEGIWLHRKSSQILISLLIIGDIYFSNALQHFQGSFIANDPENT